MTKIKSTFLAVLAMLVLPVAAHADYIPASWSETIDFNPDIKIPPAHTYYHDLTNDGFRPLDDILLTYDLIINLYDDDDVWREAAIIDLPGKIGDRIFFGVDGDEGGGWSLAGVLELNFLGTLTVTVDRWYGDFWLDSSSLYGKGLTKVPEPGTLALFGIGLIGIGLASRRRRA